MAPWYNGDGQRKVVMELTIWATFALNFYIYSFCLTPDKVKMLGLEKAQLRLEYKCQVFQVYCERRDLTCTVGPK